MTRVEPPVSRRTTVAVVAAAVVASAAGLLVSLGAATSSGGPLLDPVLGATVVAALTLTGAVVASSRPANRVGWTMLAAGALWALGDAGVDSARAVLSGALRRRWRHLGARGGRVGRARHRVVARRPRPAALVPRRSTGRARGAGLSRASSPSWWPRRSGRSPPPTRTSSRSTAGATPSPCPTPSSRSAAVLSLGSLGGAVVVTVGSVRRSWRVGGRATPCVGSSCACSSARRRSRSSSGPWRC